MAALSAGPKKQHRSVACGDSLRLFYYYISWGYNKQTLTWFGNRKRVARSKRPTNCSTCSVTYSKGPQGLGWPESLVPHHRCRSGSVVWMWQLLLFDVLNMNGE